MAAASLIPELEAVIQKGPPQRRAHMLMHITALFLDGASRFSEDQIRLFDSVLSRLIAEIETKARAELSATLAPVGNAPVDIATADLNGDGLPDFVTADFYGDTATILLSQADGSLVQTGSLPTRPGPRGVILADMDGDQMVDALIINNGANTLSVYPGNGDGTFRVPHTFPVGNGPVALTRVTFVAVPINGPPGAPARGTPLESKNTSHNLRRASFELMIGAI